jgi:hypothetical protein
MNQPTLKAFVLCDSIADKVNNTQQKDLYGAGLCRIDCAQPFPAKLSFWAFIQIADQKKTGHVRLSLMRADSGRRYFFRPINVHHETAMHASAFCVRFYDCTFPEKGVYFVELWYDGVWLVDQRLEIF